MKLQNLAIIFVIIILPISLVLSAYNRMQIDTIELQTYYNEKLADAVYNALKAYKINVRNNPYSIHEASRKRDIEAANNTFFTSLTTALNIGGYGADYIKPYIPAIIYTLYDGFYMYAPTYNENNSKYEHMLKPYITYSARYKSGTTDIIVSYTLDNYLTIIGEVNGEYVNKSGYLIEEDITTTEENLTEKLLFNGVLEEYTYVYTGGEKRYYEPILDKWFVYRKGKKIYTSENISVKDKNATQYATQARDFSNWIKQKLSNITVKDMIIAGKTYNELVDEYKIHATIADEQIFIYNAEKNKFEDENSIFSIHKKDVIKVIMQEEIRTSIANYNKHSGALAVSYNFKVPILTDKEWNNITNNISMTAFMQGLPMGFKTYNSYVTIINSENTDYSTIDNLCFINLDEGDSSKYHKIDCPRLTGTSIIGYRKVDFQQTSVEYSSEDIQYYFKHTNLPCYNCIVNQNYEKETNLTITKKRALNNALARERNMLQY